MSMETPPNGNGDEPVTPDNNPEEPIAPAPTPSQNPDAFVIDPKTGVLVPKKEWLADRENDDPNNP